ncbi:hypothetical protein ASF49_15905 [Methylobacterium sp. Leaf104]|jgi:hypothetical protein|uniref:hypothetical protein n=1 Tax=Methylobacterium TaxID=407 RepID=UPI0006FB7FCB|nr:MULTISPECIES: hypothetical protein [Methylobacterium]KQP29643.1 hypothetical protein ASF49_15905 [Methylobacterium sp. Leaf104]KQQ24159.1 hypothetical protein ASF58_16390 [Methylobacterium sp. Leaf125]MCI9881809.1 hypothetical protein [Methylobacterium goesingense]
MPWLTAPPLDFEDLPWRLVGERQRYGNARLLHVLDAIPQTFQDAYRGARAEMIGAGYSWTDKANARSPDGTLLPCWWTSEAEVDVPALRAAVDAALAKAGARRGAADRRAEQRAEADEVLTAPIRQRLQDLVAKRLWSLGKELASARELMTATSWTAYGGRIAERWLEAAEANRVRAEARLARPAMPHWLARAQDPAVRAAVHEGLKYLAELDEDWASEENGRGYSQATSWTGHALAERDGLSELEAAHGLQLLHGHRRQLPPYLAYRALGIASATSREAPAGGLLPAA